MNKQSQCERILNLLKAQDREIGSGWVSLKAILGLGIASHTRRIHELRTAGHQIEMEDVWEGKQRRVWYRLVKP